MSFFTYLSAFVALILVTLYILYKKLMAWEEAMYNEAPVVDWTHEDMISAGCKKETEMTENEFTLKYGAWRHEIYRSTTLEERKLTSLNKTLHNLEMYLLHGGPARLRKKISIRQPIFIIGDFRSGTSVLERIICHHPEVCYFTMTHTLFWMAPKIFDAFIDLGQFVRESVGHGGWNGRGGKGIYWPHSSDNLLNRCRPFEGEVMWKSCRSCLLKDRHNDWLTLDSKEKNPDNQTDCDLLTEEFDDPEFEQIMKDSIRLLLSHQKGTRFINKNPLNGFRIGYLYKMFPDAKFIHISRDPCKTTQSQRLMQQSFERACYFDEQEFRKGNMKPKIPKDSNKDTWGYLFHGQDMNLFGNQCWFPRLWPRTVPEHQKINEHLKNNKQWCANAVGVAQHERVAWEAYKRNNITEDKQLLTLWLDDLFEDAFVTMRKVFKFLDLEATDENLMEWLGREDFQQGKVSETRKSVTKLKHNQTSFGDETDEVVSILKPLIESYQNRPFVQEKWKDSKQSTKDDKSNLANGVSN